MSISTTFAQEIDVLGQHPFKRLASGVYKIGDDDIFIQDPASSETTGILIERQKNSTPIDLDIYDLIREKSAAGCFADIEELPEDEEMVPLPEYRAVVDRFIYEIDEKDRRIKELEASIVKPLQ